MEAHEKFTRAITKRGNDDLCYDGKDLGFSIKACECCGSSLAGDRHTAHKHTSGDDIRVYEVCTDCINYIANGELPEQWGEV